MTTNIGNCGTGWPLGPSLETSCPERQDFGSFVGRTPGAAKEEEAVYGWEDQEIRYFLWKAVAAESFASTITSRSNLPRLR